jgi:hypothetical protein
VRPCSSRRVADRGRRLAWHVAPTSAVAQHRDDLPVDGLGGQGVPQLVGVDVAEPGRGGEVVQDPGDRVSVLPWQQQRMVGWDVGDAARVWG